MPGMLKIEKDANFKLFRIWTSADYELIWQFNLLGVEKF